MAALLALLSCCLPLRGDEDDDEPPVVHQPAHFNGAIGSFRVTASAAPTEVQAESPITYTVRITAVGAVKRPPQRPKLANFSGFKEAFYIEENGPPEGKHPNPDSWEFTYLLKPKSVAVDAVPGFPFVTFKPGMLPRWRGYQTTYVPSVPIKVMPREQVGGGLAGVKPIDVPESFLTLADYHDLHRDPDRLPSWSLLAGLLLVPPAGCTVWYIIWRRCYPDAARQARQRRSRAARVALAMLHRPAKDVAQTATVAVARYLHQRFDLAMADPTPAEAAAHLAKAGLKEDLVRQTADFFRASDAARFAPNASPPLDLRQAAEQLILALEVQT